MRSLRTAEPFCMKLVGWLCPYKPLQTECTHRGDYITPTVVPLGFDYWVHLLNYFFHLLHATKFKALCSEHKRKEFLKFILTDVAHCEH